MVDLVDWGFRLIFILEMVKDERTKRDSTTDFRTKRNKGYHT